MRYKALVCATLLAVPGLAHADITAVYAAPNTPMRMTIKIASNGDLHGTMVMGSFSILTRGGQGYMIHPGATGPEVSRVEDLATVTSEHLSKLDPQFRAQMAARIQPMVLVMKGTETINGRTGDAYYLQLGQGGLSPKPIVVISHDPALAPLGRAMTMQFRMSMKMAAQMMPDAAFQPMLATLEKGTPLLFAGAELQTISTAPIAASEFALPAPVMTLDQVRQSKMVNPPANPPAPGR